MMQRPNNLRVAITRLFLGTALLFLAGCGTTQTPEQPTVLPTITQAEPTEALESPTLPPALSTADTGGPRPVPTDDNSSGARPTIVGPIVGTSVAGGPVEGPPLSQIGTPTPHPTLVPGPDGVVVIKSADRPTTAEMRVGDTVRLELEDFYDWTVGIGNPNILEHIADSGGYRAVAPGTTTIELMGDPKCLKFDTPCGAPSIGFTVAVTVR